MPGMKVLVAASTQPAVWKEWSLIKRARRHKRITASVSFLLRLRPFISQKIKCLSQKD
jgi:hypothetical protein